MQIETKRASLDTLAVTIQALHVNGKQMTLAVFRQLPLACAYKNDGSLMPFEFWGIVRYQIKDCDAWVICASDGRLYRCPLHWHGGTVDGSEWSLKQAVKCVEWWHKVKEQRKTRPWGYAAAPGGGISWDEGGLPMLESQVVDCAKYLEICKTARGAEKALSILPQLFIAV